MLSALQQSTATVGSGQVVETLLNGQYRVLFRGVKTIATSQAGTLVQGQQVTIARTESGLKILSAGSICGGTAEEVVING